jgi:predicted thioesterase
MKPELVSGLTAEVTVEVKPSMCPHFDGVLVHPVFATWELVHYMEVAGRKLLVPYLEKDEEGIGAHVSVDHRAPATIGSVVTVRATAETVMRHRLVCHVEAHCGDRLLGEGRFIQIIMPRDKLETLIRRSTP